MNSDSLIEISLIIKNEFVEPVSYVFKKFSDYDFVITEDIDYNPDENEKRPKSDLVTIKSYLEDDTNLDNKLSSIQGALALIRIVSEVPELIIKKIYKKDWLEQKFPSINIGEKFIITNDKDALSKSKILIKINPGLGFGTGHHPTTKMMLEKMENLKFSNKKILDFGCGSGILSIAAKKLGAKKVTSIEIDDLAINSAKENIKFSNLSDIDIRHASIEHLPKSCKFDIILANISSNIIINFSELIYSRLVKGGLLLCSGILSSDMDKTIEKLKSSGFISLDSIQEEDWCCLELKIA